MVHRAVDIARLNAAELVRWVAEGGGLTARRAPSTNQPLPELVGEDLVLRYSIEIWPFVRGLWDHAAKQK
jgi:hypothetical protein